VSRSAFDQVSYNDPLWIPALLLVVCLHGCSSDHATACDQLLDKAASALQQHEYAQAQRFFDSALKESEQCTSVLYKVRVLREQTKAFLAQGDPKQAEATARSWDKLYDGMPMTGTHSARIDLVDNRSRARIMLSQALSDQGRYDECTDILAKTRDELTQVSGSEELLADIDERYVQSKRSSGHKLSDAEDVFEITNARMDSRDTRQGGERLFRQGHLKESLPLFQKAQSYASGSHNNSECLTDTVYLALAYYAIDEKDKARVELAKGNQILSLPKISNNSRAEFKAVSALLSQTKADAQRDFSAACKLSFDRAYSMVFELILLNPATDAAKKNLILQWMQPTMEVIFRMATIDRILTAGKEDPSSRKVLIQVLLEHARDSSVPGDERARSLESASELLDLNKKTSEATQTIKQALEIRKRLKSADVSDITLHNKKLAADRLRAGSRK
jgi:tetratricopeptide (TPR) repeat protein